MQSVGWDVREYMVSEMLAAKVNKTAEEFAEAEHQVSYCSDVRAIAYSGRGLSRRD